MMSYPIDSIMICLYIFFLQAVESRLVDKVIIPIQSSEAGSILFVSEIFLLLKINNFLEIQGYKHNTLNYTEKSTLL